MGMGMKCMSMGIKTWEWENTASTSNSVLLAMFHRPNLFIYLFIYDELVQQYTEKYKEKKIKQMNIEYCLYAHLSLRPSDHYNWLKVVDGMTPRHDSGQGTGPDGRLNGD